MARLECICGASMTTSICPSPNTINIFTFDELKKALINTPDKLLWYFYADEDNEKEVEYWYCPQCKRVYFVESKPQGKIIKIYKPSIPLSKPTLSYSKSNFEEFFILFDTEIDALTELNFNITISDYFKSPSKKRYFYDRICNIAYVFTDDILSLSYEEEHVTFE